MTGKKCRASFVVTPTRASHMPTLYLSSSSNVLACEQPCPSMYILDSMAYPCSRHKVRPKENEMSLFVVQHKHEPAFCPAGHPEMGPALLKHISAPNAANFGITVQAEGVLDGQHTLYMVLDAAEEAKVREFMAPFAQAGSVEVWPASHCEKVVERAQC
jgi:hypothetical protein